MITDMECHYQGIIMGVGDVFHIGVTERDNPRRANERISVCYGRFSDLGSVVIWPVEWIAPERMSSRCVFNVHDRLGRRPGA